MTTLMDKFKEIEVKIAELKALVEDIEPDPYAEGDRRYDEQRDNEQ